MTKTISPAEILHMATVNGARALGLAGQIGELSESSLADFDCHSVPRKILIRMKRFSPTRQRRRQHD